MKYEFDLILRVALALLLGIFNNIFYVVFTPLTLFYSWFLLDAFHPSILIGNTIHTSYGISLKFIDACTAGAAYLLLFLLILLTKGIDWKVRFEMMAWGSIAFLVANIARIGVLFYILFVYGQNMFDSVHLIFWKIVSTVIVFAIWVWLIKKFKIKTIPVYSDVKYLWKYLRKKK